MRVLRPIVQSLVRAMLDAGHDLPLRRAIGAQLVGDHHTRRTALPFQDLAHQTFRSLGIAATLHQHVENKAVLIDGPPKPVFLSTNGDDNLIKIPFVAEPAGRSPPDIIGKVSTEFLSPKSNGLMRDDDATRCQQILDHPQAQRKPEIEPNGMGNHLRWKSMATIKRITRKSDHSARSHILIDVRLTSQCRSGSNDILESDCPCQFITVMGPEQANEKYQSLLASPDGRQIIPLGQQQKAKLLGVGIAGASEVRLSRLAKASRVPYRAGSPKSRRWRSRT